MTNNDMKPVATADIARRRATRADTTTQVGPAFEMETLPEPPKAEQATEEKIKKPMITLSTTVQHRGRVITITAADITVDRFCDLLDAAHYAAPAPAQWQTLPDGTPICPKHNIPMRLRNKQGDEWHSHRVYGPDGEELWCKGYRDKSSPGYEY